jgi:hypothetical protein
MFKPEFGLDIFSAKKIGGEFGQDANQGEKYQRIDDIKKCMGIGNVPGNERLIADADTKKGSLFLGLGNEICAPWG